MHTRHHHHHHHCKILALAQRALRNKREPCGRSSQRPCPPLPSPRPKPRPHPHERTAHPDITSHHITSRPPFLVTVSRTRARARARRSIPESKEAQRRPCRRPPARPRRAAPGCSAAQRRPRRRRQEPTRRMPRDVAHFREQSTGLKLHLRSVTAAAVGPPRATSWRSRRPGRPIGRRSAAGRCRRRGRWAGGPRGALGGC